MIIFPHSHAVYTRFENRANPYECDSKIRAPNLQKRSILMPPITKRRQEDMQQRGPMPDVATLGAAAFGKERVFMDS